jgi:hypothetical protein
VGAAGDGLLIAMWMWSEVSRCLGQFLLGPRLWIFEQDSSSILPSGLRPRPPSAAGLLRLAQTDQDCQSVRKAGCGRAKGSVRGIASWIDLIDFRVRVLADSARDFRFSFKPAYFDLVHFVSLSNPVVLVQP